MLKEIVKQRIEESFSKLEKDPSLLIIPFNNLEHFKKENYLHPKYLKQWENVLKLPLDEIKNLMLSENDQGEILRSTSIFVKIP